MAITESYASADPRHYVWWFPGSPIKVHLDLQVIEGLQTRLRGSGSQSGEQGLLIGRVLDGATEILEFRPALNRTVPEMIAELSAESGELLLVGYYRTEHGDVLHLNEADLSLFERFFGKAYHVFLVIQPSAFAPPNATFFFCRGDHKMAEFPFLEFPLDASLLATEERDRISRCRQSAEQPPVTPVALPAEPKLRNLRTGRKLLLKLTSVGILVAGLTLIATWITTPSFRTRSSQAWSALWGPSAVRSSSPSRSYPHIGLQARTQDRDLEVSWNRESPWITAATSGLISIEDGASKRQITLDSQQLRGERILYSPTSDQVLIQLTITTSGAVATESVRVLLLQSGKAKTTSPEVFQSSSTAVETRARPQSTQLTQALKPFTGPSIPMSNASPAVPLLNEPPPQDLHSDTPASRFISPGLSQTPAPPQMPMGSALPSTQSPEPAPRLSIQEPTPAATTYYPPIPSTKVAPRFPPDLKALVFKPVTVAVRVSIDKSGKVLKAEPLLEGNIHQLFITEAVHAARLWTFQPAHRGKEAVPSESVLHFAFKQ